MHFEHDQEAIFDELQNQLHKVNEHLTFEISTIKNGKREFIISADGIREAFSPVIALFDSSPKFNEWTIIAFRPPIGVGFSITIADYSLGPEDIWFLHEADGDLIGLVLYIRDLNEENEELAAQASYILLDTALGEFVVETKVSFIEREPLPSDPGAIGLLPFTSIVDVFDEVSQ